MNSNDDNNDKISIDHFSIIYDKFIQNVSDFNNKQQQMNAKIAHEIKNPLTIIRSMLQLIEKSVPAVAKAPYWHSVFNELDYVNQLLNSLTNFCRSTYINKEVVNINSFMKDIKSSFQSYATEQSKYISLKLPFNDILIEADPIKLKQALSNLIKNAFEATDTDALISIICTSDNSNLTIRIKDTGKGIEADKVKTIFEPFVSYNPQGTGLGLSIVKNIIKEHNGKIQVESIYGSGTTFTISLPLQMPSSYNFTEIINS
ncbi:phospho-acceptor domain-containing protein [Natranaerovirga pectinivora]|uniref:histidine kinase n=1 Tax=Natranaerovirga pectinivora TaxID=682400 RepID=A0A4R3MG91_9FIRM|nr:HAMP domain-containing sensor histidine kinase [Natranaerovirga pectinivora]TCT12937.1 phospho-acceptor domain-containing protein [Natranaerovirga pectinivora]